MAIRSFLRGTFVVAALVLASMCLACQPGEEKQITPVQQKEKSKAAFRGIGDDGDGQVVDKKLAQSFGPICEELQRPLRLWLADKLVAIAAGNFVIEKDGRVKLAPFSAALYHTSKIPNAYPEISTIRADVALLTLDQPVATYAELKNRKVIAVEMIGHRPGIALTNNRRTAEKEDDIDVLITNGNLFYEARKNLIWTDGVLCLKDYQAKPPIELRGKGFEMKMSKPLTGDTGEFHASIEKLVFRADVDAHFVVDGACTFLGISLEKAKLADEARLHIRTNGTLIYDLIKGSASIEAPPRPEERRNQQDQAIAPDQVLVVRTQMVTGKKKFDQLLCDRLDLQIRRNGANVEIVTAKATGDEVVISLDGEGVAAYGSFYSYERGGADTAANTVLKGRPLRLYSADGIKLSCTELHLIGTGKKGKAPSVTAVGPGELDLLDLAGRRPGTLDVYSKHIQWRDKLIFVNARAGLGDFDSLKAYGNAAFIDDKNKQEVRGKQIDVKLGTRQAPPKKP